MRSARERAYHKAYREQHRERLRAYSADWRSRNPDYARNRLLEVKYGITLAERDALLAEQGGGCAICGTRNPGRWWCVDHDHACCAGEKTCGQCVRGVLCETCNTGIGWFGDDPERLRRAAAYLVGTRRELEVAA